jgi:hypothetical protein
MTSTTAGIIGKESISPVPDANLISGVFGTLEKIGKGGRETWHWHPANDFPLKAM